MVLRMVARLRWTFSGVSGMDTVEPEMCEVDMGGTYVDVTTAGAVWWEELT